MTKKASKGKTPTTATVTNWEPLPGEQAPNPRRLELTQVKGESTNTAMARHAASPVLNATQTINSLLQGKCIGATLDATALLHELQDQADAVNSGKLARGEAMLTAQAHTLDAMFNGLIAKAMTHKEMAPYETLLRLAFKAQSQCRATWESVSEIKNPRSVAFVKQANIANGHQQINNGSGAREIESEPTKLLETTRNEWMDPRATGQAGRGNQTLETVGAINGTAQ